MNLRSESRVDFKARFFLIGDEMVDLKVWCDELFPMSGFKRSGEEWVQEYIDGEDADSLRSMLDLPSGDYQCLIEGNLRWYWHGIEDEWDESFETTKVQTQVVPYEFARSMADDHFRRFGCQLRLDVVVKERGT